MSKLMDEILHRSIELGLIQTANGVTTDEKEELAVKVIDHLENRVAELKSTLTAVWYPLENYAGQTLDDEVIERVLALLEH